MAENKFRSQDTLARCVPMSMLRICFKRKMEDFDFMVYFFL